MIIRIYNEKTGRSVCFCRFFCGFAAKNMGIKELLIGIDGFHERKRIGAVINVSVRELLIYNIRK